MLNINICFKYVNMKGIYFYTIRSYDTFCSDFNIISLKNSVTE